MDVQEQPEGGGGLEVIIGIFRPCVGDFCPAYPLVFLTFLCLRLQIRGEY